MRMDLLLSGGWRWGWLLSGFISSHNFVMLISGDVTLEMLQYFILTLWLWCSFLINGKIALFRLKNSRNCDHAKESYTATVKTSLLVYKSMQA